MDDINQMMIKPIINNQIIAETIISTVNCLSFMTPIFRWIPRY